MGNVALYKDFSGLADLSQIVWTSKISCVVTWSKCPSPPLSISSGFCTQTSGSISWAGWSWTIIRGDSVDFTWAQWTSPSCCKHRAHHNSICKLVLNPFSPLGTPQSWDGTAGTPPEKSHKDVQCLFQQPGKAEPFKERWGISNEWSKRCKCLKRGLSKHWLFCELTPESCWGLELPV